MIRVKDCEGYDREEQAYRVVSRDVKGSTKRGCGGRYEREKRGKCEGEYY